MNIYHFSLVDYAGTGATLTMDLYDLTGGEIHSIAGRNFSGPIAVANPSGIREDNAAACDPSVVAALISNWQAAGLSFDSQEIGVTPDGGK